MNSLVKAFKGWWTRFVLANLIRCFAWSFLAKAYSFSGDATKYLYIVLFGTGFLLSIPVINQYILPSTPPPRILLFLTAIVSYLIGAFIYRIRVPNISSQTADYSRPLSRLVCATFLVAGGVLYVCNAFPLVASGVRYHVLGIKPVSPITEFNNMELINNVVPINIGDAAPVPEETMAALIQPTNPSFDVKVDEQHLDFRSWNPVSGGPVTLERRLKIKCKVRADEFVIALASAGTIRFEGTKGAKYPIRKISFFPRTGSDGEVKNHYRVQFDTSGAEPSNEIDLLVKTTYVDGFKPLEGLCWDKVFWESSSRYELWVTAPRGQLFADVKYPLWVEDTTSTSAGADPLSEPRFMNEAKSPIVVTSVDQESFQRLHVEVSRPQVPSTYSVKWIWKAEPSDNGSPLEGLAAPTQTEGAQSTTTSQA